MTIETLGDALRSGWRVRVRCAFGNRAGLKSIRECQEAKELDLPSLVWTRGRNFPLARLGERMMCPACGSLKVTVMFDPPAGGGLAVQVAAAPSMDRNAGLKATVDHFGANGSIRRRLAAAVHTEIARGAFEVAIREVELDEGEQIILRQGSSLIKAYPELTRAPHDAAAVNAEYAKLREGLPKGRTRRWK
ncbi:hypothetical protein [Chenggangzhangella methanolivorans]|uniref:hypothetical protein n=1 Tax=Chenggangzhangella methanolivorans TaxID=1437009 RepID=UPI0021BD73E2|nr:hypothetical protein [Chenggangzhangella methanolivorans]